LRFAACSRPGKQHTAVSIVQIKLKLEQSKEDKIAAKNRQQLLAFLNSSTGD